MKPRVDDGANGLLRCPVHLLLQQQTLLTIGIEQKKQLIFRVSLGRMLVLQKKEGESRVTAGEKEGKGVSQPFLFLGPIRISIRNSFIPHDL